MATSVQDALLQIIKLTQTNLEILQGINNSFFTKNLSTTVSTGSNSFIIPSFLTLENKLNALQENFDNLVQGAKCGEAWMSLDGSSKILALRSYQSAPTSLNLDAGISEFNTEKNYIFKDFLSPRPYITFSVTDLPNDIVSVLVKKVIPLTDELKNIFTSYLGGETSDTIAVNLSYADLYKVLSGYVSGTDYEEYDTEIEMPVRKSTGSGTYVINSIVSDTVSEDLEEFIVVNIRTDVEEPYNNQLTYKLFDETIEKSLSVGDYLTTWDGSAKLQITEFSTTKAQLTLKVVNNEYLNLVESAEGEATISDYAILRFYSPVDYDDDKYVKITLEEDQYIFVAIAGLNKRLNVQASWGTGLILNTYLLTNGDGEYYSDYYKNISNIGDLLYDITSMFSSESITHLSQDEYTAIKNLSPSTDGFNVTVVQINSHLDNSETVTKIRTAYALKKSLQTQLNELNDKITELTQTTAEINFDDVSGQRAIYISQLSNYNTQKNELEAAITSAIDEISQAANDSVIPIENAKYRIRGYYDTTLYDDPGSTDDYTIKDIEIWYRYKNLDETYGTAQTIGDSGFIFSDWNIYDGPKNYRTGELTSGSWDWKLNESSSSTDILINQPHYNQIDIPITQGETVDIRVRFIYEMGQPFVQIKSGWSEIYNVEFPEEYLANVEVLDIIEENNNEITTNKFNNILSTAGITEHVDDAITDQDITYYHKPDNISSGFYTDERRIIPLSDKLLSMDTDITSLLDIVNGTTATSFTVTVSYGDTSFTLTPYQINNIILPAYNEISSADSTYITSGNFNINSFTSNEDDTYVSTYLNINITNNTSHSLRLFSMFPGDYTMTLNDLLASKMKFDKADYVYSDDSGTSYPYSIPLGYTDDDGNLAFNSQCANQFITFRHNNPGNGEEYYDSAAALTDDTLSAYLDTESEDFTNISVEKNDTVPDDDTAQMSAHPLISNKYSLALYQNESYNYITINAGETITIPVLVEIAMSESFTGSISRVIAFDLRPTLYDDPVCYMFRIVSKYTNTAADNINITSKAKNVTSYISYNTVVK